MVRRDLRLVILEAAERVVDRGGMTRATTRDVAAEAGCGEGSIYNHFRDRPALLAAVVVHKVRRETDQLSALMQSVTAKREAGATVELIEALLRTYHSLIAFTAPALADGDVLDRLRDELTSGGGWVGGVQEVVQRHIVERQSRGELDRDVDAQVAALLVTGACHEHALHSHLFGVSSAHGSPRQIAKSIRRVLFEPRAAQP